MEQEYMFKKDDDFCVVLAHNGTIIKERNSSKEIEQLKLKNKELKVENENLLNEINYFCSECKQLNRVVTFLGKPLDYWKKLKVENEQLTSKILKDDLLTAIKAEYEKRIEELKQEKFGYKCTLDVYEHVIGEIKKVCQEVLKCYTGNSLGSVTRAEKILKIIEGRNN